MHTRAGSLAVARTVILPDATTSRGDQVVPEAQFNRTPFLHATRGLGHLWSYTERGQFVISHQPAVFEIQLDDSWADSFLLIATQALWNAIRPEEVVETVRGQPQSRWTALQGAVEQHARLQQPNLTLTYMYIGVILVCFPAASN